MVPRGMRDMGWWLPGGGRSSPHLQVSVRVQSGGAQAKQRRSSGRCCDALGYDGHSLPAVPVQTGPCQEQFLHRGTWLAGPGGAEACEETASPPQEPVHGHARGSLSNSASAPQLSAQP